MHSAKGVAHHKKSLCFGEGDFVRDNSIKVTAHVHDVATEVVVTPRGTSYYQHLSIYVSFTMRLSYQSFDTCQV